MSAILPGYNYDIFISYRQKDNKHDGWVTEFVNNLKGELESTFKEEISVYFDINPHDGLLETYDVDASLKEKLKCLIFIPIISRTYCDPKSFAWEHEFKPFLEIASNDKIGLKVKLAGGNVASRVLPVVIHELDDEDKKILEVELKGYVRGVEFIFRERGINKPLKPDDDEKNNLNRTKYTYQINKVANAVKDILRSFSYPEQSLKKELNKPEAHGFSAARGSAWKLLAATAFVTLIIIAGFLLIRGSVNQKPDLEKSIAVIPFTNNSPDREHTDYIVNGLFDEIINSLQQIKSFSRVLPRNSVEKYRSEMKSDPEIAKELNVNYILSGSAQRIGDKFVLKITLTDARKDNVLKTYSFNEKFTTPDEIFNIYSNIAQSVAADLKAEITPEEKEQIEKTPIKNLMAFDYYQRGKAEEINFSLDQQNPSLHRAELMYRKALSYDSTFAPAYAGLANVSLYQNSMEYYSGNYLDSCLVLINKSLSIDPKLPEAYFAKGFYYLLVGNPESALHELDNCLKYNPNYWKAYEAKAYWIYDVSCINGDFIEAIVNIEKAISLNNGKERARLTRSLGNILATGAGFNELAIRSFKDALSIDNDSLSYFSALSALTQDDDKNEKYLLRRLALNPGDLDAIFSLGDLMIRKGDFKTALQYFRKIAESITKKNLLNSGVMHRIAYSYWLNGYKEDADSWFRKEKDYDLTTIRNNRYEGSIAPTSYYNLACVYAFEGKKDSAYLYLKKLDEMRVFPAWWIWYFKNDPLLDNLRKDEEFGDLVNRLNSKYQAEHERVRKWLEENNRL